MRENITIILIAIILIYSIYTRAKMYNNHLKALKIAQERRDLIKIFTGQTLSVVYTIILLLFFIGGIFVYYNQISFKDPTSWIIMFIAMFTFVATDFVRIKVLYTTHYNDHGMFIDTDYIRFKSIKKMKTKPIPVMTELYLFNNTTKIVPTTTLKKLDFKIMKERC